MPDVVGVRAGEFVLAASSGDSIAMFFFLSRKVRETWRVEWARRTGQSGPVLDSEEMTESLRAEILDGWHITELKDVGVSPTRYFDHEHARVLIVLAVDEGYVTEETESMPMFTLPMVREDGEWRVDEVTKAA